MKNISDHIKAILALIIIVGSFTYFFLDRFSETKGDDQIIIAIVGMCSGVIGYFYGSTNSSSKKDDTIQDLAKKKE